MSRQRGAGAVELRNLTKTLFPGRGSFCRKKREIMESFALQKHPCTAQYYCCWERMDRIKIEFHPWDKSHFIFKMKVISSLVWKSFHLFIKNILKMSQTKLFLRVNLWFCLLVQQKMSHFLWTKVFCVFSPLLYCWIGTKCDPILKHRSLWSFCCANWGKKRTDTNLVTKSVPLSQRPNLDTSYFEPPWKWWAFLLWKLSYSE